MSLGNNLFHARKKKGLSQEEVAEKLSRQTISKWETDETLPDIRQSKHLAVLYGLLLDELIEFDIEVKEIQEAIDRTSEEVDTSFYAARLDEMQSDLQKKYGYNELDAFLVLKDILAAVWKNKMKD